MQETQVKEQIKKVVSGDSHAYTDLVEGYKGLVYSICMKILNNQELAEEAAQDTFIKAFKNLKRFKGDSKFSTWLYQIAYFTAINASRKKKVEKVELNNLEVSLENDLIEADDRKNILYHAINQLKPDEKAIITLYYLDEFTLEEVSEISKITVSNVKVKVHRIKKKLNSILENILSDELKDMKYG